MTLTLVLKRDDPAGFERYMKEVYDPHSARYRHFLTQAQIARKFGPSRSSYAQVLRWLQSHGLELVEGSKNRLTLTVAGSRASVERAFALKVHDYRLGEVQFYANDSDPALPTKLAPHVAELSGLSNLARPQHSRQAVLFACNALHVKDALEVGGALRTFSGMSPGYQAGVVGGVAPEVPEILASIIVILSGILVCLVAEDYNDFANKYPSPDGWGGNGGQWWNYPQYKFGQSSGNAPPDRASAKRATIKAAAGGTAGYPDGSGQTIGLLEFDGFNQGDVSDFVNLINTLNGNPGQLGNLSTVPVNGGIATPGAAQGEVLLDIDVAMGIAPGAKVAVYEAPFDGRATSYTQAFNAMINGGVTVISNSWASCEDQVSQAEAQSIDTVLQAAAASGISVFNAAGDSGSTCLDGSPNTVAVPADSPSATAVGGTTLVKGPEGSYGSETWWDGTHDTPPTGQGGFGVSRYFTRPSYQQGLSSSAMRSVPDVVALANPATDGFILCQSSEGGCPGASLVGGTSMSAPTWAALAALLNQTQGHNLGAFNPLIYPLAGTDAFHGPASMGSDFAHVGLGSPNLNVMDRLLKGDPLGAPDASVSQAAVLLNSVPVLAGTTLGLPADGSAAGELIVRLLDANGHTVSGKSVAVTAPGSSAVITPASATTNVANGAAVFTISDMTPETVTFSITDTTDGIPLTATPSVVFGVPSATGASLNAFPTSVTADGSSTTTLTVVLKDSLGRPAPGKLVSLSQGAGHSIITGPSPSVTDSNGQIQFTATDDQNETITYTALDIADGDLPVPGSGVVTYSAAGASDCITTVPTAANGYALTTFAKGFPAGDFFYGGVNFGGCGGATNPTFLPSGTALIPDFRTGVIYALPAGGGDVSSGGSLNSNPRPAIGTLVYGKDGKLYTALSGTSGSVVEIDPATGAIVRTVASGLTCPSGLAVDPLSGDLFFDDGCSGAGTDNPSLWRIANPGSTNPTVSVYATLPASANTQIAFAPNGTLYVLSGEPLHGYNSYTSTLLVRVGGTNTGASPAVTTVSGVTSDNGLVIGKTQANGDAQTLLVHVPDSNGGTLETVDITANPPAVDTVLATGDIGAGVVGPDGCYYVGAHHDVYKLAPSSGNCGLTPTSSGPALTLAPASLATNPVQGSTQTFTAVLENAAPLAGVPVLFIVRGANPQVKQAQTDASGTAAITYTGVSAGNDSVTAMATLNATGSQPTPLASNQTQLTWTTGSHVSSLSLNLSPTSGTPGTNVGVIAFLADTSASPTVGVPGQTVTFALGSATCNATTGTDGKATCQIAPPTAGNGTLSATFAGTSQLTGASATTAFSTVGAPAAAPTTSISVTPSTVAAGASASLSWSSSNATSCTASGAWTGTQATAGTQTVTPSAAGTYSYTLSCTGAGGTASATAVLSANIQTVSVSAKSGGGALDWRVLLLLVLALLLRAGVSPELRALLRGRALLVLCCSVLVAGMSTARADDPSPSNRTPWAEHLYVGIRAGSMRLQLNSSKLEQQLAADGYTAANAHEDRSATSGTVYIGYELDPKAAIEFGYTHRNAQTFTLDGAVASAASIPTLLGDATRALRGYGSIYSFSFLTRLEPLPRLSIDPRLGPFFWDTKVTVEANGLSESTRHAGGGGTAGVGIAYRLWRGLHVGVGVDYFRGTQYNVATLYGGSLEWRFGYRERP